MSKLKEMIFKTVYENVDFDYNNNIMAHLEHCDRIYNWIVKDDKKEKIETTNYDMLEYIKCQEDIVYFAERYFYIGNDKIKLRQTQIDILQDKLLGKQERQSGSSTAVIIKLLHSFIFSNGNDILICNNKHTADTYCRLFKTAYNKMPYFLKPEIISETESKIKTDKACVEFDSYHFADMFVGKQVNTLVLSDTVIDEKITEMYDIKEVISI